MMRIAFALTLVAACTSTGPSPAGFAACDGSPGLHVVVDLSGPVHCDALVDDPQNERTMTATLASGALDGFAAAHVISSSTPPSLDYLWRWPAGTADGWNGTITWSGSLEALTGRATAAYQVDTGACETVALTAECSSGVDAGP